MYTKDQLIEQLKNVPDPELGISIVDLGLVYDAKMIDKQTVEVTMTLTTMGCPLFDLIAGPAEKELKRLTGIKKVIIELTFEPPWSPEKMSPEGKVALGFF
jgi:metal-sulfur cluster biosynthetic enzyme